MRNLILLLTLLLLSLPVRAAPVVLDRVQMDSVHAGYARPDVSALRAYAAALRAYASLAKAWVRNPIGPRPQPPAAP